ncbi:D-glycero-beta-D-manno-heptose-7-phosphate kinase [Fusobacterium sp. PH5-44]|uniref:D-glycero-beta-D-manno-heptose-7-phosphate kinase n=1 Tax=unclassified Fusobacterium TaxID=2648384 RepID=UPI003D1C755F
MKKNSGIKEILNRFKNLKIGVVGDYMLDEYIIGSVDRISPEAPVPIVNVRKEKFSLGGAANVARNIAALGAKAVCLGLIGKDLNGEKLIKALEMLSVDISEIIVTGDRPTTVKTRIIGGNQQLLRIDWENLNHISEEIEEEVLKKMKNMIKELDGVILSDYNKGLLTPKVSKEIIKLCKKNKKVVIVDPKPKNALNYVGADSMTPNRKEALECLGYSELDQKDIEEVGKELKEKLKLKTLLITRSEEGMSLFSEKVINIPTFAKEVYDVTGAGDTVISLFTLGAALKIDLIEAAKIANTAAGIVVGRSGTSTASNEEIAEFYEKIYLDK